MNISKEKNSNLTVKVHNVCTSVFIFGEMHHSNKIVMQMLEYAQNIRYNAYVLIDDCYTLQETNTKFICICRKCEQEKANAIITFEEENNDYNNDYIEYVEILTCGQDTKILEEQDAMLITAKYKYLIK